MKKISLALTMALSLGLAGESIAAQIPYAATTQQQSAMSTCPAGTLQAAQRHCEESFSGAILKTIGRVKYCGGLANAQLAVNQCSDPYIVATGAITNCFDEICNGRINELDINIRAKFNQVFDCTTRQPKFTFDAAGRLVPVVAKTGQVAAGVQAFTQPSPGVAAPAYGTQPAYGAQPTAPGVVVRGRN